MLLEDSRPFSDALALAALVRREYPSLLATARRILVHEDLAQDAVQESFLALVECSSSVREPGAWLQAAVRLRSLHLRRSHLRQARRMEPGGGTIEETVCTVCDLPDDAAAARERAHLVRCALDELPREQRQILWLHYGEGRAYQEIAELLGVPVGTVRSRMHRAREAFAGLARCAAAVEGWTPKNEEPDGAVRQRMGGGGA